MSSKTRIRSLAFIIAVIFMLGVSHTATRVSGTPSRQSATRELQLIGQSPLDRGPFGDIWVHKGIAYLGTSVCGPGVKVVDVSNPQSPRQITSLVGSQGSSHEDIIAINVSTPAFRGDLLAVGLQAECERGRHGVQFWDVTDPRNPVELGFFDTGDGPAGVHELFMLQRGERVFAFLAVPSSERFNAGGDFRIIDATDPRNPVQVADWGLRRDLRLDLPGSIFCHSVWANETGTKAYLAYWDAGLIILDISEPATPRFLGRSQYAPGEEGNAHSAWPIDDRNLVLITDEDFSVAGMSLEILQPGAPRRLASIELPFTRRLCSVPEIDAEIVYAGRGCKPRHYPQNIAGKIALVDADGCGATKKVRRAQQAGAAAVLIVNTTGTFDPTGNSDGINLPGAWIGNQEGEQVKEAISTGQPVRVKVKGDPLRNTWGFVRIYDTTNAETPAQIATFATPRSLQCPTPTPTGWYTVHNPFVVGDTLYLSWYADGVRIVDISDPASPRELASYVPPGSPTIWGVYVEGDLVFLSDLNHGLFVLRERIVP